MLECVFLTWHAGNNTTTGEHCLGPAFLGVYVATCCDRNEGKRESIRPLATFDRFKSVMFNLKKITYINR